MNISLEAISALYDSIARDYLQKCGRDLKIEEQEDRKQEPLTKIELTG